MYGCEPWLHGPVINGVMVVSGLPVQQQRVPYRFYTTSWCDCCWDDGGYGHVAVVTAVESTTRIQVSEANMMVIGSNQLEIIVNGLIYSITWYSKIHLSKLIY